MDAAEEVGGEPVVACGETAGVLKPAKHALDGVAAFVQGLAKAAFPQACALERDVRDGALALDQFADAVGVVGAARSEVI